MPAAAVEVVRGDGTFRTSGQPPLGAGRRAMDARGRERTRGVMHGPDVADGADGTHKPHATHWPHETYQDPSIAYATHASTSWIGRDHPAAGARHTTIVLTMVGPDVSSITRGSSEVEAAEDGLGSGEHQGTVYPFPAGKQVILATTAKSDEARDPREGRGSRCGDVLHVHTEVVILR